MTRRVDIPGAILREVRQRCRFGCVLCGCPLYEYDHIVEYSKTRKHEVDNLALLCHMHHGQKSRKQLPAQKVKQALDQVLKTGTRPAKSSVELHFDLPKTVVEIGGNIVNVAVTPKKPACSAIVVDDTVVLGIKIRDGRPVITSRIFDQDNRPLLVVRDGHLSHAEYVWDITYVGTKLTIWQAPGNIMLEIDFQPPDRIVINRGRIFAHGVGLQMTSRALVVINNAHAIRRCIFDGAGIGFGERTNNEELCTVVRVSVGYVPRYRYRLLPSVFVNLREDTNLFQHSQTAPPNLDRHEAAGVQLSPACG